MQVETLPQLVLRAAQRERIEAWAVEAYPEEACGVLIGRREGAQLDVWHVTSGANIARERRRDRFELDPAALVGAEDLARNARLEVLGIWHSHPDHPAAPSTTDLERAWENWSYVIVSVTARGAQALTSWRLVQGRFAEQEVVS